MMKSWRLAVPVAVALGALLGYAAGSGRIAALLPADENKVQTTGEPGSPSATTTIPGNQLPPLPQKFEGKIERNAAQSKPYWPARVVPPKGAPNVLLIMTDDTGFGVSSTFGGVIPSPALDRIAKGGLRYTNFNSDRAVLADARRTDNRTQPPFDGVRRGHRAIDGLPRLQQRHDA
jgi:hypothetical protein